MTANGSGRTTSKSSLSPAQLRRKITQLDRQLVKQLNERARLYQQLAEARRAAGQAACDVEAERRSIDQLAKSSKGPLDAQCVRTILREVNSASRRQVVPLRVAFLGPLYSYSHLAANDRFGEAAELIPVSTIAAVFEEVDRRQADYGLVPIENSTDGRIVDTLDMLARLPVRICGEVQLRIHHHLLGRCERSEVREVYSKPQALSQCREWLAKHLPEATTIETSSTAAAAQVAAEKHGVAAVASRQAAVQYGLDVLAANIEDHKDNVTRFAVIGNEVAPRTGNDKTSLLFQIPHKPGALADATAVFKRNRLNMTWIESFPMPGRKNEYLFFVELEGHQSELRVRRALAALEKKTIRLEILGSYAVTEPVD